jgi:serine/threonine protein kinase
LDSRLGLPINTVLDGSYRIERVVGSGGFGITYEAEDVNLGTAVAIKEYYPFDFGDRDATMSVKPKSDRHQQTFNWGRSNFLQEARTLARFEHPSIVRVTRVFEANSTAYMVMRFEQGQSFEDWLRGLGRLPTQEELDSIVAPLLDALQMMHAENFLHRDIAPDNIIVRADGTPVLLDFGAARRAVAEMSRTMTGIVKAGYSPHEQYSSDSRLQGPWSDLYALGGTLYRAVTGHPPEEATLRVDEDHMPPAAQVARKSGYRSGFLSAIDMCLKVRHSERPRSVAQLRPLILGRRSHPRQGGLDRLVEVFRPSKLPQRTPSKPPSKPPHSDRVRPRTAPSAPVQVAPRRWAAIAAAILAVIGGAYGGFEYSRWQPAEQVEAQRRAEAAVAKKKADEEAAQRQQASKVAEENAFREAEARRQADVAAARKRAEDERARHDAEAKRVAEAAAAMKLAEEERARQEAEAKRQAEAATARKLAEEERARQEAEAKRVAEAAAAKKKADEERARQEAETKRLAEAAAAAAKKRADEEKVRQEAEARRLAEAAAAKKKADEERARQEAEAKRLADAAAAKKRAEEEAQAKREEEQRVAAEKTAAADAARRQADSETEKSKIEDPTRVASITLNAQERATFVKRIQEVLKQSKCYEGDINGSTDDAQRSLDRYIKTARQKGKDKPERIELAKASASDFDSWLRESDEIKGGLCAPVEKKPVQSKPMQTKSQDSAPRRQHSAEPRPQRSYGGGGGGGGGGGRMGTIQGIQ